MHRTGGSSSTPLLLALLVMMWPEGSSYEEMPKMMPPHTLDDDGLANLTVSANSSNVTLVIPFAPVNLQDVCDPATIDSIDQVLLCEDACANAECCWKTNTCVEDIVCEHYSPCTILVHATSGPSDEYVTMMPTGDTVAQLPPPDLPEICSA
ncbi:expressed unknown protein (Partial), partial [Seminavis robusta]|eukprot:Sro2818_g337840.1 n/a (151) ;mRNA; f:10954-11406